MLYTFWSLYMPLLNITKIVQTLKSYRVHKNGLEIRSGETSWKKTEQELSFLHATFLLDLIFVPIKYYQIISNGRELWPAQDFCFRGNNYITKAVRVVPFARSTPTGPLSYPYQILSNYLKQYGSYDLHKTAASGKITTSRRKWGLFLFASDTPNGSPFRPNSSVSNYV